MNSRHKGWLYEDGAAFTLTPSLLVPSGRYTLVSPFSIDIDPYITFPHTPLLKVLISIYLGYSPSLDLQGLAVIPTIYTVEGEVSWMYWLEFLAVKEKVLNYWVEGRVVGTP